MNFVNLFFNSYSIVKFNLEHKRIRQQKLTLKITGNRSTRFEERVLEKDKNESAVTGNSKLVFFIKKWSGLFV